MPQLQIRTKSILKFVLKFKVHRACFHQCSGGLIGLAVTTLRTSTKLPYTLRPVSTGMGDRVRVKFPVRDIYLSM